MLKINTRKIVKNNNNHNTNLHLYHAKISVDNIFSSYLSGFLTGACSHTHVTFIL